MIVDVSIVVLTAAIAGAAAWMAFGLLRRKPERVEKLAAIGFASTAWPTVLGLMLLAAVVGLIVGWWRPIVAILALLTIKVMYTIALILYRRAGKRRDRDLVTVVMAAHTLVAVVALVLLVLSCGITCLGHNEPVACASPVGVASAPSLCWC